MKLNYKLQFANIKQQNLLTTVSRHCRQLRFQFKRSCKLVDMLSTEGEECDRNDATKFTKQIGPVCAKPACDYLDFDFSFIKI